jgi:FKBP-type peptidyl-prolyl cis-trans isomerase SlyD
MKIEKDTVVTLRYKVSDLQGKLIEEAKEPTAYLHGGYGNTLAGIEAALHGPGGRLPDHAAAAAGRCLRRTRRGFVADHFAQGFSAGREGRRPADGPRRRRPRTGFHGDEDQGRHRVPGRQPPLAGKALRFSLKVIEVRAASPEEVPPHAHGAHGHHH